MASINRESNGRRTIQFVGADGKRRSLRLGKVSQRMAEGFRVKVEALARAVELGQLPDDEVSRWLAERDQVTCDKLAAVGLIPKREVATLEAFLNRYITMRADVKAGTAVVLGHTRRNLVDFFGADKPLREITSGDAEAWRINLIDTEKLADNTVRRRSGIAKQFFRHALKHKLIYENPFSDLVAAVKGNASRFRFVTLPEAYKVLEKCPDVQWKLLFALSRFGGLRCPSEHLGLKWGDIDWENNRMTVHSLKTEHHEGKETRVVPIFPELRPYLADAFDQAEEGTEYVITICRNGNKNFRTRMLKIIRRAGLTPWPKLFQNLRSTRQTELEETFPSHVVCAWIGNSEAVARRHYLQVTDDHFARAVEGVAPEAVQNPVQQPAGTPRNDSQAENETPASSEENEGSRELATCPMGDEGFEPPTSTV
jgi:integrase